ncbi:MAG: hypothetical protein M1824_001493 [Vezdaea acicularis]|nr:MAG: hypothetical protein M1824_001493 [Vezdaea acicularis]
MSESGGKKDRPLARNLDTLTPKQLYGELSFYLGKERDQVHELDILPSSFIIPVGSVSPVLHEGNSIAIRKRDLVKAFSAAREGFFKGLASASEEGHNGSFNYKLLDSTRVILFFDPEHLTAANFRKRHLVSHKQLFKTKKFENGHDTREGDYLHCGRCGEIALAGKARKWPLLAHSCTLLEDAVAVELALSESYLTSPLHRHSKSPTLWNHRRWVISEFGPGLTKKADVSFRKGEKERIRLLCYKELAVVIKAAERHPKNYYAWNYLHLLLSQLKAYEIDSDLIGGFRLRVGEWCQKNPGDTSGWSFMLKLISPHVSFYQLPLPHERQFQWDHEAFRVFARTLLASGNNLNAGDRKEYVDQLKNNDDKLVKQTLEWVEKYCVGYDRQGDHA